MLRLESETGYYLITHPDHAQLAGAFAARWGNALFPRPRPLAHVLHAIHVHDDGWAARDAHPSITRAGKPSAFSIELVGKYSAFEEIDLADYLAVRERAVSELERDDPYTALLVSLHTFNLLTARADRSTIRAVDLSLLDAFLDRQHLRQQTLTAAIRNDATFTPEDTNDATISDNFRLLQACDNLSLLSCVAYEQPATLLHPLPTTGGPQAVRVVPLAERHFRLSPYPFAEPDFTITLAARHVQGKVFSTVEELRARYATAPVEQLFVRISA
jgi:hypothetical protein